MRTKVILMFVLLLIFSSVPIVAFAGDTNMDNSGGGNNYQDANGRDSFWNEEDGVRATLIKNSVTIDTMDYTNYNPTVNIHFGYKNKRQYMNVNETLDRKRTQYDAKRPVVPLPKIVNNSNAESVKNYFRQENVAAMIAHYFGLPLEELIEDNGDTYKLLIEPIAYVVHRGEWFAFTATEAALYDEVVGGALRSSFVGPVTHRDLPNSLRLETPDLGFPDFNGTNNAMRSNDEIKSSLGVGIVTYGAAFAPTGEINWGGGSMKEDYREDRENSRRRIYSPKPVRAVFASDLRYKYITDDEYYPFRSGYYFNPTGTYTTTVQTVVNATSPNPTREHADLVNAAVGAFRYESDMVYLHPDTRQAVTIDAAPVSKNGTSYKATKRSVSPNSPPTNQRLFNITDARQHTLTYEIIDEESPEGEADTHNYIVTETTQITITVNPENTKVYTHAHMADGNYSVRAYIDPTGITTTVQLTTPLDRIIELDAISIMVVGSMYDDIR